MRDFDAAYTLYNEFQRNMERYWCLRWLLQEKEKLGVTAQEVAHLNPLSEKSPPIQGPLAALSPASGRKGERENQFLIPALVLRENLVKLVDIPLVGRISSLPETPPNTRVALEIGEVDLLDLNFNARFISAIEEVATCQP